MESISLSAYQGVFDTEVEVPSSKSISNRLLILSKFYSLQVDNLSNANDTLVLAELLEDDSAVLDCQDAGTVFRFLTAYKALQTQKACILTGTERMKQRPIKDLVNVLLQMGAKITYLGHNGFPPVQIEPSSLKGGTYEIAGDKSSQFISALMLIAPALNKALHLVFNSHLVSFDYIKLTAEILVKLGLQVELSEKELIVYPQKIQPKSMLVETDWSSAAFLIAWCAGVKDSQLFIKNLNAQTAQSDCAILNFAKDLGFTYQEKGNGLLFKNSPTHTKELAINAASFPDLVPVLCVLCALKRIKVQFSNIEHLRLKESDRIDALNHNLQKIGCGLIPNGKFYELHFNETFESQDEIVIKTFDDHRVAMAFSMLALKYNVLIDNKNCVNKSFPNFWEVLVSLGVKIY